MTQIANVIRRLDPPTPVSENERSLIGWLKPGRLVRYNSRTSSAFRFATRIQKLDALTHMQRRKLWRLAWHFRAQMPQWVQDEAATNRVWAFNDIADAD